MSNSENTSNPRGRADKAFSLGIGNWRGLVWTSFILSAATAVILLCYGTKIYGPGSLLMTALSLPFFLGAMSAHLVLHADKIRKKMAEVRGWKKPEWGENVENPYEIEFNQQKIVHFLVYGILPALAVLAFAFYVMWNWTGPADKVMFIPMKSIILISVICAAGCAVWLMIASSYSAAVSEENEEDVRELSAMGECAWEFCWWMGLTAVALGVQLWLSRMNVSAADANYTFIEKILSWVILCWTLAVGLEFLVRLLIRWMMTKVAQETFEPSVNVFLRYIVFVKGNPIYSFFYTVEQKCGVSFRSSWSIRFVARSIVPAFFLAILFCWGLTCLYVVQINELGIRRDCGKIHREILQPGLHWKLPYPFGTIETYPVKQVHLLPVGFEQSKLDQISYIWTKEHGKDFNLVLGTGTEMVVIHAVVHYKIREDESGFFDYVMNFQNPEDAITNFTYHCLTELTRTANIDAVLDAKQNELSDAVTHQLQSHLDENHMGVDVVSVSMLNLHPPTKASKDYLSVISEQIDAESREMKASGDKDVILLQAKDEKSRLIDQAKVDKAVKIANASNDTAGVIAAGRSFDLDPKCYQFRYWLDSVQALLWEKRLILIDDSVEVLFDTQQKGTDVSGLTN